MATLCQQSGTEDSTWSSCLLQRCESRWRTGRACGERRFAALRRSRPWRLRRAAKSNRSRENLSRVMLHMTILTLMLVCGMLRQKRRGTYRSSNVHNGQGHTRGQEKLSSFPGANRATARRRNTSGHRSIGHLSQISFRVSRQRGVGIH